MTKNATFWTLDHETMRVLAQLRDDMGGQCVIPQLSDCHVEQSTSKARTFGETSREIHILIIRFYECSDFYAARFWIVTSLCSSQ